MKDNFFHFITAGSGPAGSAAALNLARAGYSVAIIERKSQPRYKVCGGAVPAYLNKLFDFDIFGSINCVPIGSVYFTYKGGKDIYSRVDETALYGVDRSDFDFFLYKKAVEVGAKSFTGEVILDAQEFDDYVQVKTKSGKTFRCKFLIGADGANSIVRSKLFSKEFKGIKTASSLVWETDNFSKNIFNRYHNCTHMDFNWLQKGYFGLIPKFDHFTLGGYVAGYEKPEKLKKALKKFCEYLKFDTSGFKPAIRYYPYYDRHRTLNTGRTVLLGDAACLVDKLSGEGIKYAVMSGINAAKVLECALHGRMSLSEYTRLIHSIIGKELLYAKKMARISYLFPSIAYEGLVRVSEEANKILNGQMSYSVFIERLSNKIKRKILNFINPFKKKSAL
ncbi:MAG: geranylgeranyl reductase family protein [Armatimonadota bacterium]